MKTPVLSSLCVLSVAAVLAGCIAKDAARTAAPPPLFRGVPIPREAHVVDTATTPEAIRATLVVGAPPQLVLAFYRRTLPQVGFRIMSDVGDSVSADLYAQRDGPPLWVQVRPGAQPGTARFTLIAAVGGNAPRRDSAARDTTRRAAPR